MRQLFSALDKRQHKAVIPKRWYGSYHGYIVNNPNIYRSKTTIIMFIDTMGQNFNRANQGSLSQLWSVWGWNLLEAVYSPIWQLMLAVSWGLQFFSMGANPPGLHVSWFGLPQNMVAGSLG